MSSQPLSAIHDMHSDGFFTRGLAQADPEIAGWIAKELGRQRDKIELIASENITSLAVLEACGSVLTNKYAEGYPGKRYFNLPRCLLITTKKQLNGLTVSAVAV